jgi:hypothetical protein
MSTTEAPREAYHELANFIRQNPEAISLPAEELSLKTGVPESVVRQVLEKARQRRTVLDAEDHIKSNGLLRFGERLNYVFLRATERPVLFVGLSTIAMLLITAFIGMIDGVKNVEAGVRIEVFQGIVIVTALVLQMACFYRHARARIALFGGLVYWLAITRGHEGVSQRNEREFFAPFYLCFTLSGWIRSFLDVRGPWRCVLGHRRLCSGSEGRLAERTPYPATAS